MKVNFNKMPSYGAIFGEARPANVEELLNGIPSEVVIGHLSLINSLIYDYKSTAFIISNTLPTLSHSDRASLICKIYPIFPPPDDEALYTLFRTEIVLRFISYELKNYRNIDKDYFVVGEDLKMFKAYIWFASEFIDEMIFQHDKISKNTKELKHEFQEVVWPIMIRQYEFIIRTGELYKLYKAKLFFDYLFENEKYKPYSENYLKFKKFSSIEEFMSDYVMLIKMPSDDNGTVYEPTYRIGLDKRNSLFDALTINLDTLSGDGIKTKDHISIREKPLFLKRDDTYYVLSWDFLHNIFDLTLLFDFYANSGINTVFNKFLNFKGFYSKEIMEWVYFKRVIESLFRKKHYIIKFDDVTQEGLPDCYIRDDRTIYLFEFKDAFMASDTVVSYDYEKIRDDVYKKFVKNSRGKNKGISQLLNQIKLINEGGFKFDQYIIKGLKPSQLKIIPIIIYSHSLYRLPGVNSYLNEIFQQETKQKFEKELNVKILPLTIISFEFLVSNLLYLRDGPYKLKDLISTYSDRMKQKLKKSIKLNINQEDPQIRSNNQYDAHRCIEDEFKEEIERWNFRNLTRKEIMEQTALILQQDIGTI